MTEHTFALSDMRAAIKAVTDGGHSVYSPSGSKMWLGCSGSLIPNLFAPDDAGEDAAYGTVGHMVGETWLKTGRKPVEMIGTWHWVGKGDWPFYIEVDEVMLDHVQRYVDWCEFLPGDHFVETKVYFSQLTPIPNQGGTADHVACSPGKMVITDLKMGKGVHVYAKHNSQALLYALGFFYEWDWFYDFQDFEIRIAQPRRDNMDVWHVTRAQLLEFAEYVKVRAHAAWIQNAPRTPSPEACQWCRVKATCAAFTKATFDMTGGAFDDIGKEVSAEQMAELKDELMFMDGPPIVEYATLTTAELETVYGFRGAVEKYFSAVEAELFKRTKNGEKVTQWKLVESRSRRAFRHPMSAAERLIELGCKRKDVITTVVCSPAQAEELLRKVGLRTKDLPEALDGLIFKPPGKATLAHVYDRRPPITDISGDAFVDLIEKPGNSENREEEY